MLVSLPALHPGRLLSHILVAAVLLVATIESTPLASDSRDIGDQPPDGINGPGNAAISKRQLPVEGLNQLTSALRNTYKGNPGPGPDNIGQVQGNDTNLTRKETIPSSFFYSEKGLYVRCNSADFVLNLQPWNHPDYPDIKLDAWKNVKTWDREKVLGNIHRTQYACRQCKCDEEGRIIPRVKGTPKHKANFCTKRACFCTVDLIQPVPTSTTATVEDYQAALDRIPESARAMNYNYRWLWGGQSLRFGQSPPLRFANGMLPPERPPPEEESVDLEDPSYGGLYMVLDPNNGYYPPAKGFQDKFV
ncbi:hypothetical protein AOL_s00188g215 [Orbilia oligospora ATCC 24927]|uniref:Uncharacterized protein n=1 Tax=Arthrobotrys oligospora (strain ATCC 24927 / CBS 115.81 / DSM 1491) TaxID=756982 RepID=G1XQK3_ARTOA|nr:hypothetical protein AOL_s00188g215 [Orbilia oligospora ATCC 24927]EGX44547.1 hypothetical protein AOL_s00188g215 [Orbilia oligospora ATCC 24927]